ncbi:MAG: ornithine carbamoyltransferase [Nanoarchaeota archaeon]
MHLLSLADWKSEQILDIIDDSLEIKKHPDKYKDSMKDKTLLMIFEKPSLRTRLSFEAGMTQMGGHGIFYSVKDSPLGKKETMHDTAKTASRYVDIIMARLNKYKDTEELAMHSDVPVIDALSDEAHPCQIIADLQTIKEKKGKLKGLKLCYLGDANNNVTYSMMHGTALMGMDMTIGCPNHKNLMPDSRFIEEAKKIAEKTGASLTIYHDAKEAITDADVVYTDSWMSYHISSDEEAERKRLLLPFQVDGALMKHAHPEAIFMNCLPAIRGYEQTAEVIDGPQSVVFDQAENRLHAQKAIMLYLLKHKSANP